VFRNVGQLQFDAGEIPQKKTYSIDIQKYVICSIVAIFTSLSPFSSVSSKYTIRIEENGKENVLNRQKAIPTVQVQYISRDHMERAIESSSNTFCDNGLQCSYLHDFGRDVQVFS
jgi:hypothetical protein